MVYSIYNIRDDVFEIIYIKTMMYSRLYIRDDVFEIQFFLID